MKYKFNALEGHFDLVDGAWTASGGYVYPATLGDFVGIGTATPSAKLEVDATPTATGTELITNGTFTGGYTGWTITGPEWTYSNNHMEYTLNETYDYLISNEFATDASKTYILTFTVSNCSAGIGMCFNFDKSVLQYNQYWGYTGWGDGTYSVVVKTDYTGSHEQLNIFTWTYGVGNSFHIDNVSFRECTDYADALKVVGFGENTLLEVGGTKDLFSNVAMGLHVLEDMTTASSNVALGFTAMQNATTAQYNVAIGGGTLNWLETGTYNVAIGYNALNINLGNYNLAIGANCLQANTTGEYNCGFGRSSLQNVSSGNYNVAIGGGSLLQIATDSYNTAIGHEALYFVGSPGYESAKNTAIGYHAGYNYGSGGSSCNQINNSVLIGYDVRPAADSETNEIVIGYGAVGNGSNTTTIGNSSTTATYLKGNLAKLAGYNGIAGVANVIPSEYATVGLATQGVAIGTTTLYAVPASGVGMYRISYYAKVTRAATTTSTLGALTIGFTDPDAVALTIVSGTDSGNTTSSIIQGQMIVYAKASTNITYAMAYASSGATTMQYRLQIRLEAI